MARVPPLAISTKIVKSAGASKVSKRHCVQKDKNSCELHSAESTAISQRQIHGRVPAKLAKCSVRTCAITQCYGYLFCVSEVLLSVLNFDKLDVFQVNLFVHKWSESGSHANKLAVYYESSIKIKNCLLVIRFSYPHFY